MVFSKPIKQRETAKCDNACLAGWQRCTMVRKGSLPGVSLSFADFGYGE
jgi:hypothetical protein